jgi:hypothetical protein
VALDTHRLIHCAARLGVEEEALGCQAVRVVRALLTKLAPYRSDKPVRFRAGDRLLAFLEEL